MGEIIAPDLCSCKKRNKLAKIRIQNNKYNSFPVEKLGIVTLVITRSLISALNGILNKLTPLPVSV